MPQDFKNKVVGLVRFSYPAESGFRKSFETHTEREAFLYDPDRLERRFYWFEKLTLPSLLNQSDPDFTTLVLVGKSLPAAARNHLTRLLAPLKGARVFALPPFPNYIAVRKAFRSCHTPDLSHFTTFRLDDDDALCCDYVSRVKTIAQSLARIENHEKPFVVAFNRGYFLDCSETPATLTPVVENLPLGIGCALVAPTAIRENIYRRNHRFLPMYYSTYCDSDTPAFIRTVHRDNDSGTVNTGREYRQDDAELDASLKKHFGLSKAELMEM